MIITNHQTKDYSSITQGIHVLVYTHTRLFTSLQFQIYCTCDIKKMLLYEVSTFQILVQGLVHS